MSKYLLLALSAGVLSACTLTINGSGSEGNTTPQQTSQTSEDLTEPSVDTTGTPTTEPAGTSTGAVPTTGTPSTGSDSTGPVASESTVGESTEGPVLTGTDSSSGTEGDSSDTTDTGGSGYGQCGWNVGQTYYACPNDGGVPGLADPKNNYPIDCRDQELVAGAACGGVGPAGCCTPEGNLYYCADSILVEQQCGA